jgi:hypothetical protein
VLLYEVARLASNQAQEEASMSTEPKVDPELVTVFDTQQESEAMVVQSLLVSGGIESIITNLQAPQDVLPGVGGVVVRVNAAQADEARSIIEDYKNSADTVEEDDDSDAEPA